MKLQGVSSVRNICHFNKICHKSAAGGMLFHFFYGSRLTFICRAAAHMLQTGSSVFIFAHPTNSIDPPIGHIKGGGGTGDHSGSVLVGDDSSTKLFLRFWCPTSVPNRYNWRRFAGNRCPDRGEFRLTAISYGRGQGRNS